MVDPILSLNPPVLYHIGHVCHTLPPLASLPLYTELSLCPAVNHDKTSRKHISSPAASNPDQRKESLPLGAAVNESSLLLEVRSRLLGKLQHRTSGCKSLHAVVVILESLLSCHFLRGWTFVSRDMRARACASRPPPQGCGVA